MYGKLLLPALAAATLVSAQSSSTCTQSTITINSAADATAISSCETIKGSIEIGTETGATIDLSGPSQITGDLTLLNNGAIVTLQSSTLGSIGGAFKLQNITVLSTLSFQSLESVGSISWQSLPALGSLTFGTPGVTTAKSVVISDTFLSSLDGIDLNTVALMDINNNRRLTEFSSQLGNLTDNLNIQANGLNLKVTLPNLIWISNMTIANVTSFSAPSLAVVNGSMRFDSNYFTSFAAPNLTETQTGDISFVSNSQLTNLSFPELTTIAGGFTVANNTKLTELTSFPKLEEVGGAIALRGSFDDVELPSLNDVKGAFTLSSTGDIDDSCTTFEKLSSSGGNGKIQGSFSCTSNNQNANNDTSTAGSGSSSGGSSSGNSSSSGDDSSAASSSFSTVLFAAALFAAVAQVL
ncbi:GPI-anchored cell wall organization protein ecm33 [Pleurostoma richardsiae]|uniref:GPI-anchored cell wall organization protein ecm33 n=1 Tax=Pleurostoma richardsiae TaxID=41990 RepID=A0AA38VWT4_9PEZI|nr:GPI-anchored cell wall organization protein ecm33 [Pleurostoma richardsiae]